MFTTDFGLGTLISNLSNRFGSGKMLRQRLEEERRGNYGEDLMARSEAWKAAGLHPLVGMQIPMDGPMIGYSSSAPSPRFNFQTGGGEGKVDPDTARLRKAQADLAEVNVALARKRLAEQPANQAGASWQESTPGLDQIRSVAKPGVFQFQPGAESKLPGYSDVGQVKPSESMSRSSAFPFMTATGDPALREYTISVGGKPTNVLLPYSQEGVSETLENVPAWLWPFVYQENVKHYGRDWSDSLWDALGLPRFPRRYRQAVPPAPASDVPSMGVSP